MRFTDWIKLYSEYYSSIKLKERYANEDTKESNKEK